MSEHSGLYLEALGIERFVRRELAVPAAAAVEPEVCASEMRDDAPGWQELRAKVEACRDCGLGSTRLNPVFGTGDKAARWMIIGEAPGAEEDRRGEPFVGRAGQLLDEMLRALELDRASVFIANILKCRPPANRDPAVEEIKACSSHLQRQIALVNPELILAVGRIAAQSLLASDAPLGRLRGTVHQVESLPAPLVVTYHPAYLLRSPTQKAKAWQDLKLARSVLARS